MCIDPLTIALIATAVTGAVSSAYGAYTTTQAANASADYNSDIAKRNAQIAKLQSADAIARGVDEAGKIRTRTGQEAGSLRAGMGATGSIVDEGSNYDYIEDVYAYGELDALTVERNAAVEAWGYDNQVIGHGLQSNLYKMQKRSPDEAATVSFLGDVGNIAGSFAGASGGGGSKLPKGKTASPTSFQA